MNEEVKVKRPRGNPNFVKKVKPEAVPPALTDAEKEALPDWLAPKAELSSATVTSTEQVNTYKYQYVESEAEVWLKLFSSVIGTYNSPGPASIKAAAVNADFALNEYNTRYGEK